MMEPSRQPAIWNSILPDLVRFEHLAPASPAKRRILFVTNMWPDENRAYYGSFIASQAASLVRAGLAVDVIYVRGYLGVRAYLTALMRVPLAARRSEFDIVHVHYGHTAVASIGVLARPLVVSYCGEDLLGAPREAGLTRKSQIEVAVFRQVARMATVTITKSQEMERKLPVSLRSRNYVLPNGVDLARFAPQERDKARSELGWPSAGKVMLFLGNPSDPRKNIALARSAADLVARRVPDARLHVAWGVSPEQVPTLMGAADCLLFASRSEGSPNAVKEAMACALPIVSTPVGDVPERLAGVENCYVRDPSPDLLADALVQALESGRAPAARRAVESLGAEAVAARLLEIYDTAARLHQVTHPNSDNRSSTRNNA
jgi:teichuronic acid biosynthesis glycosyltransferase TuaC